MPAAKEAPIERERLSGKACRRGRGGEVERTEQVAGHEHYFHVGYTRTFGSAVVNELRYTYGNRINHTRSLGLGGDWPSRLGLRGVSDEAFPRFTNRAVLPPRDGETSG
jgi:hypothetical protein